MKQLTVNLTENAHPHAEMMIAKAADMSLVVFVTVVAGWVRTDNPIWDEEAEYFLCLPKYEKECSHWLNGGDCLVAHDSTKDVKGLIHGSGDKSWSTERAFMNPAAKITIKPKKEKRWIGVWGDGKTTRVCNTQTDVDFEVFKSHCEPFLPDINYISFEIEVTA